MIEATVNRLITIISEVTSGGRVPPCERLTGLCPRGGTLGISGWGCAAGILEPLAYTRASSAEFCYPILE